MVALCQRARISTEEGPGIPRLEANAKYGPCDFSDSP